MERDVVADRATRAWYRPFSACLAPWVGYMEIHIRRREFISALLGGAAVAWPLTAWAQQPAKVHRIAFISAAVPVTEITEISRLRSYRAFFQELRRLGYVEGR